MNAPTKQKQSLLVDPSIAGQVTDKGITWVTDRYVMARADVFKRVPVDRSAKWWPDKDRVTTVRHVLKMARVGVLGTTVQSTGFVFKCGWAAAPAVLVGNPCHVFTAVNPKVWDTWLATGLTPRINGRGQITWWGKVRGRDALFGVVMPMRLRIPADLVSVPDGAS